MFRNDEVLGRQGCYYWSVETHVSPGQASLPELGVSIVGTAPSNQAAF